jgi:hypothetical protein
MKVQSFALGAAVGALAVFGVTVHLLAHGLREKIIDFHPEPAPRPGPSLADVTDVDQFQAAAWMRGRGRPVSFASRRSGAQVGEMHSG